MRSKIRKVDHDERRELSSLTDVDECMDYPVGGGYRQDQMVEKYEVDSSEKSDHTATYVDAAEWCQDFIDELNAYNEGRYYSTDGEYIFSREKTAESYRFSPKSSGYDGPPAIAYCVNGKEIAWIYRQKYTSHPREDRQYGYNSSASSTEKHRIVLTCHESVEDTWKKRHKKSLSDMGCAPKRLAKFFHSDWVYKYHRKITEISHDMILADDYANYYRKRVEDNGYTLHEENHDVGTFSMDAFIASREVIRIKTNHGVMRSTEKDIRGTYIKFRGGTATASTTLSSTLFVHRSHVASFLQQLPVALGPKYMDMMEEIKIYCQPYYTNGGIKIPEGEGVKMRITLELNPETFTDALKISDAIRRTDTWRAAWAKQVANKLLKEK